MYRLQKDIEASIEIKKSKFICYLHKCTCEQEAKDFVQTIRKLHPNARHHCYAFLIGEHNEIQRSCDDGEPSGSAGVPMLECLKKNDMQDSVAVTVRYFGGILLGTGGLIRAYTQSVQAALQQATLTKKVMMKRYSLSFAYPYIGLLEAYFQQQNILIQEKQYDEEITYIVLSIDPLEKNIAELTNGKSLPVFLQEEVVEMPINKDQ
ncbi:MAG: YigZ family protein [Erysipelotrichaceae bacterium]|nr:YigZ family protein [Erysipelotrichaceae bacterium]